MHFSVIMVCRSMPCDASVPVGQHIANKTNDFPSDSRFFFQNHFEGKQLHHLEHTDLHIFHIFESCLPSRIDATTLMKLGFFNEC